MLPCPIGFYPNRKEARSIRRVITHVFMRNSKEEKLREKSPNVFARATEKEKLSEVAEFFTRAPEKEKSKRKITECIY
jgi:hypothetical protein